MNSTIRRQIRGMMLLEMLMALFLASAFFLLATRLTGTIFTQYRQIPIDEMSIRSSQGLLDLLHRDVWRAAKVDVASPQSVRLTSNGGRTVNWTVDPAGTVTRQDSAGAAPAVGKELAPGLTFSAQLAGVTVHWPIKESAGDVQCVSQILLANGGAQ